MSADRAIDRRCVVKKLLSSALLVALLAPALASSTWIVGPDEYFRQIQPAIDAALPGDIILVKPGTYDSFVLSKALRIVGSGEGLTMVTDAGSDNHIAIKVTALDGEALIASVRAEALYVPFSAWILPSGRLVLCHLTCDSTQDHDIAVGLYQADAAWVQNVTQSYDPDQRPNFFSPAPGLRANECVKLFASQCYFHAADSSYVGSIRGGAGIWLEDETEAFIAETTSIGGSGGLGYWGWDCWFSEQGGPGGPGIYLYNDSNPREGPAVAHVFGRPLDPDHLIQGGVGGAGTKDTLYGQHCDYYAPGGDGGEGIWVEDGWCKIAGVTPEGGLGGFGDPPGDEGPPTRGNVQDIGQLATTTVEGDGKLGTTATFSFHGLNGDRLIVAYSTALDVIESPAWQGQPLQVSPTGTFGLLPAGTIGPSGTVSVPVMIPSDAPRGQPFYVQGIMLRGTQRPILSNISMLVTTPVWP
ncbi:MAG: hypothetical protein AB1486_34845 [Planctomycetota bacterium]